MSFELIVVDNASNYSVDSLVKSCWPDAKLIELTSNEGVAGGRNAGINAAMGETLVFLDDDASFRDDNVLSLILKKFKDDSDLGILATNSYLVATGEPDFASIPRRDKKVSSVDYATSYFSGQGFAVRRDAIDKAGLFFEDYFYSCEEVDLSWRVLEISYKIVWATDIVVLHRQTPVARTPGRWFYYNARNRVWLAVRYLPWINVISYAVFWWIWLLIKSCKNLFIAEYIRGIVDCILGLPKILKDRKPLSHTTLKTIGDTNGRLFY